MANEITPQIAQACERWLADKVLIDLLKDRQQTALLMLGENMDINMMIRAQGGYKTISALIKFIETGADLNDKSRGA